MSTASTRCVGASRSPSTSKSPPLRPMSYTPLPASRHVGGEHAVCRRERFAEHVEVTAVAADAVHADDHVVVVRRTPFVIDDAMEAVRREALKAARAGNGARQHPDMGYGIWDR